MLIQIHIPIFIAEECINFFFQFTVQMLCAEFCCSQIEVESLQLSSRGLAAASFLVTLLFRTTPVVGERVYVVRRL